MDGARERRAALAIGLVLVPVLVLVASGPVGSARAQGDAGLAAALVGTWSWKVPGGSCTETQSYRADGTGSVTSGEERSEQRWTVQPIPGSSLARLTVTTTRDERGVDCIGQDNDDTGRTVELFYRIEGRTRLILCFDAAGDECFGPFIRQRMI